MNQLATVEPSPLDQLAYEWENAKALEQEAQTRRIKIEEQILSLLDEKEEGTVSNDGEFYKVSVTYGMTRSIQLDELDKLNQDENLQSTLALAFPTKPSIDLATLRKIESAQPEIYKQIAKAISTKPRKPSVKIKLLTK